MRLTEGSSVEGMTRTEMLSAGVLALTCACGALAVYYLVPLPHRLYAGVWWRLSVAMAIFGAVLVHEVTSIIRSRQPMRRAVISLSLVLPLFVVMFSWIYLTMSRSNPASFGGPLSRTEALYFTVTVLSTVGFGDIVPKTDIARLTTTAQMISDLFLVAVVVRVIFGAATRATARFRAAAINDQSVS